MIQHSHARGSMWTGNTLRPSGVIIPPRALALITEIAVAHGLIVKDLTGRRRFADFSTARQEAYARLYELRRPNGARLFSLSQIGRMFGRDHTTILHGVRRHEARLRGEL